MTHVHQLEELKHKLLDLEACIFMDMPKQGE
jgi:hypothetical protein